jgi:hypothetical protein
MGDGERVPMEPMREQAEPVAPSITNPLTGEPYPILSTEDRKKRVAPLRFSYIHRSCGEKTDVGASIAETFAANPSFYAETFCAGCEAFHPVNEFKWIGDAKVVGT